MRSPTKWYRATLKAVAYVIVPPEPRRRHVRLCVTDSVHAEIGLATSPEQLEEWSNNVDKLSQDSQFPLCPSDVTIPLTIEAGQGLMGRSREGLVELSIIVEYLE